MSRFPKELNWTRGSVNHEVPFGGQLKWQLPLVSYATFVTMQNRFTSIEIRITLPNFTYVSTYLNGIDNKSDMQ